MCLTVKWKRSNTIITSICIPHPELIPDRKTYCYSWKSLEVWLYQVWTWSNFCYFFLTRQFSVWLKSVCEYWFLSHLFSSDITDILTLGSIWFNINVVDFYDHRSLCSSGTLLSLVLFSYSGLGPAIAVENIIFLPRCGTYLVWILTICATENNVNLSYIEFGIVLFKSLSFLCVVLCTGSAEYVHAPCKNVSCSVHRSC